MTPVSNIDVAADRSKIAIKEHRNASYQDDLFQTNKTEDSTMLNQQSTDEKQPMHNNMRLYAQHLILSASKTNTNRGLA